MDDRNKYFHAKEFKIQFGIPLTTLKYYAKEGIIRYKKMAHGTRLYHIDDGPVLVRMRELDNTTNIHVRNEIAEKSVGIKSKKKLKICYSRVDDETKSDILKYEKKLFEKFIRGGEVIQEYRQADDNRDSKLLKILEKVVKHEITTIFITNTDSIAKDTFPIINAIIELNNIFLYILKENGQYIDFHHQDIGDFSTTDDFVERTIEGKI